jgi:hypothetical protein
LRIRGRCSGELGQYCSDGDTEYEKEKGTGMVLRKASLVTTFTLLVALFDSPSLAQTDGERTRGRARAQERSMETVPQRSVEIPRKDSGKHAEPKDPAPSGGTRPFMYPGPCGANSTLPQCTL